jgi:hypothetical protein
LPMPSASAPSAPAAGAAHAACGCSGAKPDACGCKDKSVAPSVGPTLAAADDPGLPEFSRMTVAEKLAYNKAKRDRIFG